MQVKEIAKQVIDNLPGDSTMDDIIHALYVQSKFEHGENEIRQGKGITHEEARKKMQKLLR